MSIKSRLKKLEMICAMPRLEEYRAVDLVRRSRWIAVRGHDCNVDWRCQISHFPQSGQILPRLQSESFVRVRRATRRLQHRDVGIFPPLFAWRMTGAENPARNGCVGPGARRHRGAASFGWCRDLR